MSDANKTWWLRLRKARLSHWLRAILLAALGLQIGQLFTETGIWRDLQFKLYGALYAFDPRTPVPTNTAVVLIDDREYWLGEPAGRRPLKRDYLAKLVTEIASRDPAVIVLDIEFIGPLHQDYEQETRAFINTIGKLATDIPIVVSQGLQCGPEMTDPNQNTVKLGELTGAAYAPGGVKPVSWDNSAVHYGYLELHEDVRRIPARVLTSDGNSLPPLSVATVMASHPHLVSQLTETSSFSFPYSEFIHPQQFPNYEAGNLFQMSTGPDNPLRSRIVIVGGSWHERALGLGNVVDMHNSPVGMITGAFVHANYIESIINQRSAQPLPDAVAVGIELALAFLLAIFLVIAESTKARFLIVSGACVLILLLNYLVFQTLGLYADFLIPAVLIAGNAYFERILEWRRVALKETRYPWLGQVTLFATIIGAILLLHYFGTTEKKPPADCRVAGIAGVANLDGTPETNAPLEPDQTLEQPLQRMVEMPMQEIEQKMPEIDVPLQRTVELVPLEKLPLERAPQFQELPDPIHKTAEFQQNANLDNNPPVDPVDETDTAPYKNLANEFANPQISLVALAPGGSSGDSGRIIGGLMGVKGPSFGKSGVNIIVGIENNDGPLAGFNRIALAKFDGNDGPETDEHLRQAAAGRTRLTAFNASDAPAQMVASKQSAQELQLSGMSGFEALVTGVAEIFAVPTECGNDDGYRVQLRIITNTGETVFSKEYVSPQDVSQCSRSKGGFSDLLSGAGIAAKGNHKQRVLRRIEADLFPEIITENLRFERLPSKLTSSDKDLFRRASQAIKDKDYRQACAVWKSLAIKNAALRSSGELNFNLGICSELIARPSDALEFYHRVVDVTNSSKLSGKALERIGKIN